jgi:hypothetical protein
MMSIRDWEDTSVKLNHSIAKCEDTFNSLHSHLIHNLSQLLSTQGITIDYSTGENDRFCKKCNWWMKPAGSAATQPGSGSVDYVTAASGIHPAAATGKAGSVSRIYHECVNCGSIEE